MKSLQMIAISFLSSHLKVGVFLRDSLR